MAFALGAAAAAASAVVDVESLLWEIRDLLRGLGQVNAGQAAQLAQLAPASLTPHDAVSEEYAERTRVALEAVDIALNQIHFSPVVGMDDEDSAGAVADDWSEFDDSNVRAWLHSTQTALEQPEVDASQTPSPAVSEPTDDFWNTDTSFKWDDEPEIVAPAMLPFLDPSVPPVMDDSLSVLGDDAVGPWDSVSERDLDVDYQSTFDDPSSSSFSDEFAHGSSRAHSATLFHPPPLDMRLSKRRSGAASLALPAVKHAAIAAAVLFSPGADHFFAAAQPAMLAGF